MKVIILKEDKTKVEFFKNNVFLLQGQDVLGPELNVIPLLRT